MKLYYSPGACSLSPHIVAREGEVAVDLSLVTFSADGQRTTAEGEDFFKVNPKGGYVPAFRIDDENVLAEGVAIVQYIADQAPSKNVTPERGTLEYYRMLEWLTFISSELHKSFSPLFNPALPEDQKEAAIAKIQKRYAYVEEALAGKDYVLGSTFSIADAYLYTITRWFPKASLTLDTYPNLSKFVSLMETRAGVKKALEEEGLEMAGKS